MGIASGMQLSAQISFSPQYMNRAEYRHGYQSLADTGQHPAAFISQRLRLNSEYKAEKFRIVFGVQDVRTWGSVANAAIDTKGLLSVSEAYGELSPSKKVSIRLGRQILSYDDDRIIGSLDWAMQSRRHDLLLFRFTDSTFQIHAGAAFNQNQEQQKTTGYSIPGNYKTLQFLWMNKTLNHFNLSMLFLNNGNQYAKINPGGKVDSITVFSQTAGLRGAYKSGRLNGLLYAYIQTGRDAGNKPLQAFCTSAELNVSLTKGLSLTGGGEFISGTSQTDTLQTQNRSFSPFYGTNHRTNGYMDYFYVGNHFNSVGLADAYLKINYTFRKVWLGLNGHLFHAAAPIRNKKHTQKMVAMAPYLGTEIDLSLSWQYSDGVAIQGGYSQMFGTTSLKAIKGGSTSTISNWAYLMLIIRPGKISWPKTGIKS